MIENLNLNVVTRLDSNVKRSRTLINRIKKFKLQLQLHYNEKSYYPIDAVKEIKRLEKMEKYLAINYLINTNIKTQTIKHELNQLLDIKKHWENITKLEWIVMPPRTTQIEKVFLEHLESKGNKSRCAELNWRLKMALKEALHSGYYILMNTLTVAPEHYQEVWSKKSVVFRNYIYKFDQIAGKENHKYFAVVEEGSITNRNHFHVIHILKTLPEYCRGDPNFGKQPPSLRIINGFRKYWNKGFSSPIAIRTSATDSWAMLGHKWPVVLIGNVYNPLPSGSANKVANYVSKYITKSMSNDKESKKWRIRQSHKLGMTVLIKMVNLLNQNQLSQLIQIAKMQVLVIYNNAVPPMLLINQAHRQILKKLESNKNSSILMTLKAQPSIMQRLRNKTYPPMMYQLQSIGSIPIQKYSTTVISEIQTILDVQVQNILGTSEIVSNNFKLKGVSKTI